MSFLSAPCTRRTALTRLLVGASLLTILPSSHAAGGLRTGDAFPNLGNFGLEGSIPDLKGKVALVDFWASWCAPCKKSFPVMKEIQEKFASRGFTIVAVSVDEQKSAMDTFLKRNPIPFTVLHDAHGRLAEAAALQTMPTSFLVGPDGKVLAVHNGFEGEATRKQYVTEIEAALKAAGK